MNTCCGVQGAEGALEIGSTEVTSAGKVQNRRGEHIALYSWAPSGPDHKGVALLFHGYATNAKYPTVLWAAEVLSSMGLRCYCADMIGHGESDGTPGLLPSVEALVDDAVDVLKEVRSRHAGSKIILCGTSMGGAISLHVCLREQVDGLVLLSPMVKQNAANVPPAPVVAILKVLAWIAPSWAVVSTTASNAELQYTDPERRAACEKAPQYDGKMRLGTGATLLGLCDDLQNRMEEVTCPFFVAIGGKEVVVDATGPEELFRRAGTADADKVFKLYEQAQHALLAEPLPLRAEIEEDIKAWLRSRL